MQAHGVGGRHDLHHVLQDEEAKEGREVQLAKQGWQDAAVDLQVRLRDLHARTQAGRQVTGLSLRVAMARNLRLRDGQAGRQTGRQAGRQACRQVGRAGKAGRQVGRQSIDLWLLLKSKDTVSSSSSSSSSKGVQE